MQMTTLHQMLRLCIVLGSIAGCFAIIMLAAPYVYPFIISVILAILMNPAVRLIEQKTALNRTAAVALILLIFLGFCLAGLALAVNEIAQGAAYLAKTVPVHFTDFIGYVQKLAELYIVPYYERLMSFQQELNPDQQEALDENLQAVIQHLSATLGEGIQTVLEAVPMLLGKAPLYISVCIFALLGTFFICKDWENISAFLNRFLPSLLLSSAKQVGKGLKKACFGFLKAQALLLSLTFVIMCIGFAVLRIEHPIATAFFISLIDIVPYLGTGIVFVPWILYSFLTGNFSLTIGLAVLYLVIVLQRQLMEPNLLSVQIGLNPLATLIAVFAGFQLLGFIGLLAGPVLLVVLHTLYHTGVLRVLWQYIKSGKQI
ncbi:sporulation integral membrane protein YtvI [Terribacillus saccharophilus]|uniref:Sporulation integral membrane protein YtvI n=1 Tax=Terribacillus saccharophilus TaxID=361277 RepID=A0ABX4H0P5_9BACI|nr:sporulation integral membrane protein YtvI [Terribacillus saccharophilus]PAD33766.1 sporulation integral membrane protein YtvI [Terribacillus saccharophilus]PAD95054.1 sporulation integral membrane protein YtvI [Terribacillus saccharophilus]PAE00707.1 sporulation integral membrane protein YtvI [Terribacillus saccharophilus]